MRCGQLGCAGIHPAFGIGRDPARDHQADTATRPLGKVGRHPLKAARLLFKTGVHGAHQRAIAQGREAQIQGSEQMRVVCGGHKNSIEHHHGTRALCGARRMGQGL
jgi:hypothetical protein